MSEKENLQEADGLTSNKSEAAALTPDKIKETNLDETNAVSETVEAPLSEDIAEVANEVEEKTLEDSEETVDSDDNVDAHVEEIEEANAHDAEDEANAERHTLESKDYHAMSMEQLIIEFEHLLKSHKVQNIKAQVDEIKSEFNSKFEAVVEEKKEEFISEGGNEIDFYYSSPLKKRFNGVFRTYRNDLNSYYKDRENNLKANLDKLLQIIDEIKAAKLAGMGGAFFPTGLKWDFCRQEPGDQKYIVCNILTIVSYNIK